MMSETAFWDTSAVIPLCCHQDASGVAQRLARRYSRILVWWGTRVEAHGALARLHREGAFTEKSFRQTRARLSVLSRAWSEVLPVELVREQAEDLLARYRVRAADAHQLATALVWCQGRPQHRTLVCFDERLGEAGSLIGFEVTGV